MTHNGSCIGRYWTPSIYFHTWRRADSNLTISEFMPYFLHTRLCGTQKISKKIWTGSLAVCSLNPAIDFLNVLHQQSLQTLMWWLQKCGTGSRPSSHSLYTQSAKETYINDGGKKRDDLTSNVQICFSMLRLVFKSHTRVLCYLIIEAGGLFSDNFLCSTCLQWNQSLISYTNKYISRKHSHPSSLPPTPRVYSPSCLTCSLSSNISTGHYFPL